MIVLPAGLLLLLLFEFTLREPVIGFEMRVEEGAAAAAVALLFTLLCSRCSLCSPLEFDRSTPAAAPPPDPLTVDPPAPPDDEKEDDDDDAGDEMDVVFVVEKDRNLTGIIVLPVPPDLTPDIFVCEKKWETEKCGFQHRPDLNQTVACETFSLSLILNPLNVRSMNQCAYREKSVRRAQEDEWIFQCKSATS